MGFSQDRFETLLSFPFKGLNLHPPKLGMLLLTPKGLWKSSGGVGQKRGGQNPLAENEPTDHPANLALLSPSKSKGVAQGKDKR